MTEESKREAIAFEQRRLEQLGVSPTFARKANTYSPQEMWFPKSPELLSERVATRLVEATDYGISGLGLEALSDVRLQKLLTDIPIYASIQRVDPVTFNDIAVRFISGVRRGVRLSDLMNQISPLVEGVFESSLPYASEEELVAYTSFNVRQLAALSAADPATCYFFLNPKTSSAAESAIIHDLLKEFSKEERMLKAAVIASRLNIHLPSDKETEPLIVRLRSKLKADIRTDVSLLNAKEVKPERYATYCFSTIAMWKGAVDLPRKDREILLCFLYK